MLTLGTNTRTKSLATASASDLKLHTLVLGQSGSGKSYFLARLLEEILLKTSARVLAIDPNGDFETFFAPREESFWDTGIFAPWLLTLNDEQETLKIESFDSKEKFVAGWKDLIFQHIVSGRRGRMPLRDKAYGAPLKLHWKYMHPELQDFLLNVDHVNKPNIIQGIAACHYYVNRNSNDYHKGVSIRDLEEIAAYFETNTVSPSLREYDIAISLQPSDWTQVRTHFRMVRKNFGRIMYLNRLAKLPRDEKIATDLGGYIFRGFQNPDIAPNPGWRFLSVGLAGIPSHHSLLATYVALQSVWSNSIATWRKARVRKLEEVKNSVIPTGIDIGQFDSVEEEQVHDPEIDKLGETEIDDRAGIQDYEKVEFYHRFGPQKPTFVVIDEAHNFVPEQSETPLQKKVSDLIATIAAEGRKYNIFLIISTQRPQKIRKGIVAECENVAVLKLQSLLERQYLIDHTSIPLGEEGRISALEVGEALVSGRWFRDSPTVKFAPARTFLGGDVIPDEDWIY